MASAANVQTRPLDPFGSRPGPAFVRFLKTHTWIHVFGWISVAALLGTLGWVHNRLGGGWIFESTLEGRLDPSLLAVVMTLGILVPAFQSTALNAVSLLLPRRPCDDLTQQSDLRPLGRFHICIVSKGANREALRRTYEAIAPLVDSRMRLDVVTDLPVDLPHIQVPQDFQPRHARFKARALEYYRIHSNFGEHDWVLHLDEETIVDAACLEACLLYCRRSPHFMGQGTIFYNNHRFWHHPLMAVADCMRTTDDLGKFFAQYAWLNWPVFGVHGSFFLVKGTLENEITWDWPQWLTEDHTFSSMAMKQGNKCGFIDGFAWEQSPHTALDLLKQRRRWVVGIRQMTGQSKFTAYWVTLWQLAPVGRLLGLVGAASGFGPIWFVLPCGAMWVVSLYTYLLGALVQNVDARATPLQMAGRLIQTFVLYPFALLLETAAVAWAIFSKSKSMTFQVVRK